MQMFGKKKEVVEPPKKERPNLYCNFCGKSQHEVKKLIAGPNVFICNECIDICIDVLDEEEVVDTTLEQVDFDKLPEEFWDILLEASIDKSCAEVLLKMNDDLTEAHKIRLHHHMKAHRVGETKAWNLFFSAYPDEKDNFAHTADPYLHKIIRIRKRHKP